MGKQPELTNDAPPAASLLDDFPRPHIAAWRAAVERELRGASPETLNWRTLDPLAFAPFYGREAVAAASHLQVQTAAAHEPGWTIVEESALASPRQVNAALVEGLAQGATHARIRLDPAACLDESASPASAPVPGGCAVSSILGLRAALEDIDPTAQALDIDCGIAGGAALAALVALAREQGLRLSTLHGAVGGDPCAALLRQGELPCSLEAFYDELAARVEWCAAEMPQVRSAVVDAALVHEAGASTVDEIACALSSGAEQLRALIDRGVSPDRAASAIVFRLRAAANPPLEIAKLRAVRVLWAKIVKAFGGGDDAQRMTLDCSTSRRGLTSRDIRSNLVRNALAAFAAVAGGCDSLAVAPYDEVRGESSAASRRLARNQQLVLREECGLGRVADPLGGAFAVEAMTDAVARAAWERLQQIDAAGGLSKQILSGEIQQRIAAAARTRREAFASGQTAIIGVTKYPGEREPPLRPAAARPPDPAKTPSNEPQLRAALEELAVAQGSERYETAVRAAAAGAAFSEITAALGLVDRGAAITAHTLAPLRDAEPFETRPDGAESPTGAGQ